MTIAYLPPPPSHYYSPSSPQQPQQPPPSSSTPPSASSDHHHRHHHHPAIITEQDLSILSLLTSPSTTSFRPPSLNYYRRPQLDPLILETAVLSSPYQTRNHYLHEYFPHSHHPKLQSTHGLIDLIQPQTVPSSPLSHSSSQSDLTQSTTPSNLALEPSIQPQEGAISDPSSELLLSTGPPSSPPPTHSFRTTNSLIKSIDHLRHSLSSAPRSIPSHPALSPLPQVKCQARTRIPTPHGELWLHLYTNDLDHKEHLAFVIDQEQMSNSSNPSTSSSNWIRSASLDQVWHQDETEIERLIRGAYQGRLTHQNPHQIQVFPSDHRSHTTTANSDTSTDRPTRSDALDRAPIVRIHSECFTGETIGSQRCDCGEQLERSIQHIFETPPHKGAIIYLRQEGRGIGLLNKIKAYNLQELGFDTLESNLLLGFPADLRDYRIAHQILIDLNLIQVRLMTNNPNKIEALEGCMSRDHHDPKDAEDSSQLVRSIQVVERIPMIPQQWRSISTEDQDRITRGLKHQFESIDPSTSDPHQSVQDLSVVYHRPPIENRNELDVYLRTKVNRMRHLIPLPASSK